MTTRGLHVAYVLKRFPRFSETFILNELLELERQGVAVQVFSLLRPPTEPRHDMLSSLNAKVTYLPKRRCLTRWKLSVGIDDDTDVDIGTLLQDGGTPIGELFPGADPRDAAHLCFQAASLAVLATARGIDHLHAHFGSNATTVAMLAGRMTRIPFSFTAHARDIYHTYIDPEIDTALRRRKLSEAEFVATVSDYNRRHLMNIAPPNVWPRIRTVYNGIDLTRFTSNANGKEPNLVLAVGRLVEKKGFRHLIDASGILAERDVPFRCLIIGEGPERGALEHHIAARGLGEKVTLAGAQPQQQLIETMRRSSVIVLPCVVAASGDRDGLPTVLLEGLAMGIPVISTNIVGIPEIVEDGQNGLLVSPGDARALADAIQQVLSDTRLAAQLGRNGREKAEDKFDLQKNVAALVALFEESARQHQTAVRV